MAASSACVHAAATVLPTRKHVHSQPSWCHSHHPCAQWPDFDKPTWLAASDAAAAAAHDPPTGVEAWGNDVHEGALSLALRDVQAAGVSRSVRLHRGDCLQWVLPRRPALVVANPPWGQRLGGGRGDGATSFAADSSGASSAGDESLDWWNDEASAAEQARAAARRGGRDEQQQQQREAAALAGTWYDLSTFLKQQCPGTSAYLLSGNPEASTGLRMKVWGGARAGSRCMTTASWMVIAQRACASALVSHASPPVCRPSTVPGATGEPAPAHHRRRGGLQAAEVRHPGHA